MNFFDGRFVSKPSINLSGSSKQKTREDLIREAANERRKRENERRQVVSAIKIQSVFRSYLVRKRIKEEFRRQFDLTIDSKNNQLIENNLTKLLKELISFFDARHDGDRLIKITNVILKNKESIVRSIYTNTNDLTSPVLAKFLILQLKWLVGTSESQSSMQSTHLRLIDYFTDPSVHSKFNQSIPDLNVLRVLFKHLIKNDYINQLVEFSLIKIPSSVQYVASSPIAYSIAHLFYRCFLNLASAELNELDLSLMSSLFNDLFAKADLPQIKCVIENLAKIINEDTAKSEENFERILYFMENFRKFVEGQGRLAAGKSSSGSSSSLQSRFLSESSIQNAKKELCKLFSFLKIYVSVTDKLSNDKFETLLFIVSNFLMQIPVLTLDGDEDEDESFLELMDSDEPANMNKLILNEVLKTFNSNKFSARVDSILNYYVNNEQQTQALSSTFLALSRIADFILVNTRIKIHQSVLLRKLAFNKFFLYNLWQIICALQTKQYIKQDIYVMQMLASGSFSETYYDDLMKLVAPLSTFCSLYNLFLLPILDKEFLNGEAIFSKLDLIKISSILKDVCTGVVSLMHPDTPPNPEVYHGFHGKRTNSGSSLALYGHSNVNNTLMQLKIQAKCFTHLFQSCCQLVQRMHTRDIRFGYCPEDHWISNSAFIFNHLHSVLEDPNILSQIKFGQQSYLFQEVEENDIKLNVNNIRSLTILQELPFTITFNQRVEILESFLGNQELPSPHQSRHKIRIRRNYLYEDAFDNLSTENVPSLKSVRISVEMINQLDMDEAGIDGGGLFREFILQLLETGFDPNRGFFVLTSDGFLYPNPNISFLVQNYSDHYYFLGRMLAKSIECKILSPLKFAGFFLQKILSKYNDARLDIDYLASLDPQIYENLISLKDYKNDVQDLELNFAVNTSEFGQTKLVELKPGGKDILVTNDNKIEYIHLLADYKLNKQIQEQVAAFRNGISNVIDLEMLRLFNFNEIQNLISGQVEIIDVTDWRNHSVYSGYEPNDPVIQNFWRVVYDFDEDQKKKLLKFATSRSRPPLFGFKNLIPSFAIQNSGSPSRLPSASTCMNLLKLPPLEDYDTLREKLLCAIESESGFDLS